MTDCKTAWPAVLLMLAFPLAGYPAEALTDGPPSPEWTAQSNNGLYNVTLQPAEGRVEIGRIQAWILTVLTKSGEAAFPARISVGGGMQQHGHGLPTQPQVTGYGGNGEFLVEGIRFSMEGRWRLSFYIESSQGADRADVDLEISY